MQTPVWVQLPKEHPKNYKVRSKQNPKFLVYVCTRSVSFLPLIYSLFPV